MSEIERINRVEFKCPHRHINGNCLPIGGFCTAVPIEMCPLIINAIRAKAERENPKPLTLEELRKRDGKPVYIIDGKKGNDVDGWYIASISQHDIETDGIAETIWSMMFYNADSEYEPGEDFYAMYYNDPDGQYGLHVLGWIAYDHPPKEAHP